MGVEKSSDPSSKDGAGAGERVPDRTVLSRGKTIQDGRNASAPCLAGRPDENPPAVAIVKTRPKRTKRPIRMTRPIGWATD
jgi:hypothetical protein